MEERLFLNFLLGLNLLLSTKLNWIMVSFLLHNSFKGRFKIASLKSFNLEFRATGYHLSLLISGLVKWNRRGIFPRISIANCVVLHFREEPHTLHVRLSFRHFSL